MLIRPGIFGFVTGSFVYSGVEPNNKRFEAETCHRKMCYEDLHSRRTGVGQFIQLDNTKAARLGILRR